VVIDESAVSSHISSPPIGSSPSPAPFLGRRRTYLALADALLAAGGYPRGLVGRVAALRCWVMLGQARETKQPLFLSLCWAQVARTQPLGWLDSRGAGEGAACTRAALPGADGVRGAEAGKLRPGMQGGTRGCFQPSRPQAA